MKEYHKIQTVYKRDPDNKFKTLLEGQFAMPEFEFLQNCTWFFTEKVDGTNIRVMFDGESVTFGGKTDRAQIPTHLMNALNEIFLPIEVRKKLSDIFDPNGEDVAIEPVCLYGEGYGAKIQKGGGNYRTDQGFVLFDVKVGEWWLQRKDVEDVANKLSLDVVPVVGFDNLFGMVDMARGGFNSEWGDFPAEGIVARPIVELKTRSGHRIITKIKHKDFPK